MAVNILNLCQWVSRSPGPHNRRLPRPHVYTHHMQVSVAEWLARLTAV